MPKFAPKYPCFIIMLCLLASPIGVVSIAGMPEQYAPLARAIIDGLAVSTVVTMFLVPAVYLVIHSRRERKLATGAGAELRG